MQRGVLALGLAACSFHSPSVGSDGRPPLIDAPPDVPFDINPDLARRKPITIDGAKVTGVNTDFPVWIDITDAEIKARAQPDASDVFFTDGAGVALPFEIQHWDPSAGRLTAWAKIAQLASGAATVIYVRYGDPGSSPAPNPPAVFGASFVAVWHFDDALTNATVVDATGSRAGTASGGLGTTHQIPAKLGGGIDFDGQNNQIQFTNPLTGSGPHTISAWISARAATNYDGIMIVGNPQTNQSRWFHSHYYTGAVACGFYGNDWDNSGTTVDNAGWTLLHWVFEGTNRVSRVYRDGAQVGTFTHAAGIDTQGADGYIGWGPTNWGAGGTTTVALNGTLDEVRIATEARSAGWIATEFANQGSPATFYQVGSEQMVP